MMTWRTTLSQGACVPRSWLGRGVEGTWGSWFVTFVPFKFSHKKCARDGENIRACGWEGVGAWVAWLEPQKRVELGCGS